MKKKSLLFALTIASILSSAGLSSCGGTNTRRAYADFVVPEGGFNTEEDVTISFYTTMGDKLQEVFMVFLEDFEEKYPNIHVEFNSIGGYDQVRDQIKTEVSNGLHPSVAYCYPDHVALYNKAKAVIRLDNLIDDPTYGFSAEQKADFVEGYYAEGEAYGDGHMYTLPFSKSTEIMYYNKTFFEEHNLKVPTTWEELGEVCKKIKEIDPTCFPLGIDNEANLFITLSEQLKSGYTTAVYNDISESFIFDNDTNRKTVAMFKDWYDKGYFTTQSLFGSYTSALFVETGAAAQKSYIGIGSSAGANHQVPAKLEDGTYPFVTGVAKYPQADLTNQKAISQGPSVCIFNDDDPQKVMASWLFVKHFTTDLAFQSEFAIKSGYIPVLKSVNEDPTYSEFISHAGEGNDYLTAEAAKLCLEQKDMYYTSPAFIGSSEARSQVGTLMASVFAGTKTIDEAFKYAVEMCIANS